MRAGMTELVERVRSMADAGTAEHNVNGRAYYEDEDIQTRLDRNRIAVRREALRIEEEWSGGTPIYRDYYFARPNVEQATSGSEVWRVEDSRGSAIGTAEYTVEYEAGHIRFAANTLGSALYLTYRSYDLNRTAGEIWLEKAANVARRYDIKTDNHDLKRSQLRASYQDMARIYLQQALPANAGRAGTNRIRRVDVN